MSEDKINLIRDMANGYLERNGQDIEKAKEEARRDLLHIRNQGKTAAEGDKKSFAIAGSIVEYVENAIELIGTFVILEITDNSMAPAIEEGDNVTVRKRVPITNGKISLVQVEDRLLVRQCFKRDGSIELCAFNPDFPTFTYNESKVKILGVVEKVTKPIHRKEEDK